MTIANAQCECARTLFHAFAEAGVRDVVISPGSRSTPFVLAALEQPTLQCHSIIDERAASFFALGQAKFSGVPTILLCTSGSALANYMPAVVEAFEANVPLIILSADRPLELQACAENQTTDQLHFFGHHVRAFFHLPGVESELAPLAHQRIATQAIARSLSPVSGPVHLNVSASKPLEAQAPGNDRERQYQLQAQAVREERTTQFFQADASPSAEALQVLKALCSEHNEGVIAIGGDDRYSADHFRSITELSRCLAWPIVADATHPLRWNKEALPQLVGAIDLIGESESLAQPLRARAILQLGRPLIGNGWHAWLQKNESARRIVVSESGWPDPTQNSWAMIEAEPALAVEELLKNFEKEAPVRSEWIQKWRAAEEKVWRTVAEVSEQSGSSWNEPTVVRKIFEVWPAEFPMLVGNSLPVRHINRWVEPRARSARIFSRRGVSGIEGFNATAAGIAHKANQPTCLLLGDVSFLHDLTGVQALHLAPVAVVVINNAGGRIFEDLPIRDCMQEAMKYFTTPHQFALQHAAALFGVEFAEARDLAQLTQALARMRSTQKSMIINALVDEHGVTSLTQGLRSKLSRSLG